MFCSSCGADRTRTEDRFCSSCGNGMLQAAEEDMYLFYTFLALLFCFSHAANRGYF